MFVKCSFCSVMSILENAGKGIEEESVQEKKCWLKVFCRLPFGAIVCSLALSGRTACDQLLHL